MKNRKYSAMSRPAWVRGCRRPYTKSARTCPPAARVYAPHIMNSVPYSMLLKSKIQAVGAFRMYRLKTSTETTSVNPTISHANVLPDQ